MTHATQRPPNRPQTALSFSEPLWRSRITLLKIAARSVVIAVDLCNHAVEVPGFHFFLLSPDFSKLGYYLGTATSLSAGIRLSTDSLISHGVSLSQIFDLILALSFAMHVNTDLDPIFCYTLRNKHVTGDYFASFLLFGQNREN